MSVDIVLYDLCAITLTRYLELSYLATPLPTNPSWPRQPNQNAHALCPDQPVCYARISWPRPACSQCSWIRNQTINRECPICGEWQRPFSSSSSFKHFRSGPVCSPRFSSSDHGLQLLLLSVSISWLAPSLSLHHRPAGERCQHFSQPWVLAKSRALSIWGFILFHPMNSILDTHPSPV